MNSRTIIIILVIIVILGGGFFLMKGASKTQQTAQTAQSTTTMTNEDVSPTMAMEASPSSAMNETTTPADAMSADSKVKEFTVEGSNFKFVPATMTVNKGDTVKVTFKNVGGMHDFVIDELNVKTDVIGDGKSETAQFVASKTGTFEYYCSVGQHRQMGMVGTLTVK